jgi:hypothetical protein
MPEGSAPFVGLLSAYEYGWRVVRLPVVLAASPLAGLLVTCFSLQGDRFALLPGVVALVTFLSFAPIIASATTGGLSQPQFIQVRAAVDRDLTDFGGYSVNWQTRTVFVYRVASLAEAAQSRALVNQIAQLTETNDLHPVPSQLTE